MMVQIQPSFKYLEFHVNYFTIFSLITTLSTDETIARKQLNPMQVARYMV